jgi:hypothetical protein
MVALTTSSRLPNASIYTVKKGLYAAFLVGPVAKRWIGAVVLLQAILLLVPLPLLPMIPSLALVVLSLALAAEDGVAVAVGLAACAVSLGAFALAFMYGAAALGLA